MPGPHSVALNKPKPGPIVDATIARKAVLGDCLLEATWYWGQQTEPPTYHHACGDTGRLSSAELLEPVRRNQNGFAAVARSIDTVSSTYYRQSAPLSRRQLLVLCGYLILASGSEGYNAGLDTPSPLCSATSEII